MQHTQHQRTQNLLMVSKLLDGRDNASPFTLVIDSLEQSAKPLIRQYISRAKNTSTRIIYVSFETLRPPPGVHNLIKSHTISPSKLHLQITAACTSSPKNLIVIDTLHPILSSSSIPGPSAYLSSLITPTTHLLTVYHSSQPLPPQKPPTSSYQPHPLTLIRFLATTILTTHSFSHILAAKAAQDRSRPTPTHGLDEREEGCVQGLGANDPRCVVVECEMRRRSGRTVGLLFTLDNATTTSAGKDDVAKRKDPFVGITLLDEHPLYRSPDDGGRGGAADGDGGGYGEVSFNIGLTERQKLEREGVVLPYFDAQGEGGGGGSGRILYDMGSEDDFDDEEDEI